MVEFFLYKCVLFVNQKSKMATTAETKFWHGTQDCHCAGQI